VRSSARTPCDGREAASAKLSAACASARRGLIHLPCALNLYRKHDSTPTCKVERNSRLVHATAARCCDSGQKAEYRRAALLRVFKGHSFFHVLAVRASFAGHKDAMLLDSHDHGGVSLRRCPGPVGEWAVEETPREHATVSYTAAGSRNLFPSKSKVPLSPPEEEEEEEEFIRMQRIL